MPHCIQVGFKAYLTFENFELERSAGSAVGAVGGSMLDFQNIIVDGRHDWYTGFIFNAGTRLEDLNVLYLLAQSVGLFFLFCVINWALCTLFDGKGRLKGIWIAVTYALMPMVLTMLLSVAL